MTTRSLPTKPLPTSKHRARRTWKRGLGTEQIVFAAAILGLFVYVVGGAATDSGNRAGDQIEASHEARLTQQ